MSYYLMTWNPLRFNWVELDEQISEILKTGASESGWSTGKRTHFPDEPNHFFLLKQGKQSPGIVGYGDIIGQPEESEFWDGHIGYGAKIIFSILQNEPIAKREELLDNYPNINWNTQASGIQVDNETAEQILDIYFNKLITRENVITINPEEEQDNVEYIEGAIANVKVNRFERNKTARKKCIELYGTTCLVCGFNFENKYGKYAAGYIEVHHIIPLSNIGKDYRVNPLKDLIPVCPNCHAALHLKNSTLFEDIKRKFIGEESNQKTE